MKKSAQLLSLLAVLAGFSTIAAAEGVFVGGALDAQSSKIKANDCDPDDDCSLSGGRMGLGLKAGYDFGQFRVYGQYQYNLKAKESGTDTYSTLHGMGLISYENPWEVNWRSHNLTVGADYTPSFTENFKGLLGGYMGYSRLKVQSKDRNIIYDSRYGYIDKGEDTYNLNGGNGFIYGLRLGGIYSFNEHNELEFGVKAEQSRHKFDDEDGSFKLKHNNYGAFVGYECCVGKGYFSFSS